MSDSNKWLASVQAAALKQAQENKGSGGCPPELEEVLAKLQIIKPTVDEAMKVIDSWLKPRDRQDSFESLVMDDHAFRLCDHAAALVKRVSELGTPLPDRTLGLSDGTRILNVEHVVVESELAYDQEKINALDERDIRDALEFDSELKDMFGFAWIDDEARGLLRDALNQMEYMLEDGVATTRGVTVSQLKLLMKQFPRGFGRYYSGNDPFPRPAAQVQAEIDTAMPHALEYLRFELKEALELEGAAAKAAGGADGE
jgi:hypothetical protein